ncbi:hypothetical protein DW813_14085 [Roseburia inulinivorans]|mgnify:FL=1|uniref:Uncharacterized protein n=1 Tax=Roseburia inulinivorans TaxID=360807 RepID=A0A396ACI6_9FIRM|nr:hypothetical protein DW813_14085 [Roseburia inulinivorans]
MESVDHPVRRFGKSRTSFFVRLFSYSEKSVNPEFYDRFLDSISYAKYTKKCGKAFLQFSQNYENEKEIY